MLNKINDKYTISDIIAIFYHRYFIHKNKLVKIHKYFIFLFFFITLFSQHPVYANAESSDGYIVKIKNTKRDVVVALSNDIEEIGKNKNIYYAKSIYEIEQLRAFGDIEYIEPNYEVKLFSSLGAAAYDGLADYDLSNQPNLRMINAENAWEIGCHGNNVRVGVLDSGVYAHNGLNRNLRNGYNYYDSNYDTNDNNGHGTFVSGIIASQYDDCGIYGIARRAEIIPLKCFGNGMYSSLKTIVNAIYGAVDDFDCQIINMSMGIETNASTLSAAIDYALSKNVTIVAAVGNDGSGVLYYPAAYDNVIGVGSVNAEKLKSNFSQVNNSVFITAPGNSIKSLSIKGDGYRTDSGTSFSTPHVAAAVAIMKCIEGTMDIKEIISVLAESAEDLGEPGYDTEYGFGLLDISSVVENLLSDKAYFVSPVDKNENVYSVCIYNNNDFDADIISIFTSRSIFGFEGIQITNARLSGKKSARVNYFSEGKDIVHYLWDGLDSMRPIFNTREIAS